MAKQNVSLETIMEVAQEFANLGNAVQRQVSTLIELVDESPIEINRAIMAGRFNVNAILHIEASRWFEALCVVDRESADAVSEVIDMIKAIYDEEIELDSDDVAEVTR